jgi:hypothetical protein
LNKTGGDRCEGAVAQTALQSSSEEQETTDIFSGVIWATACEDMITVNFSAGGPPWSNKIQFNGATVDIHGTEQAKQAEI